MSDTLAEWTAEEVEEAQRLWSELQTLGRDDDFPTTVIDGLRLLRSCWRLAEKSGVFCPRCGRSGVCFCVEDARR